MKQALQLKATLENVAGIRATGGDFRWYFKVKCGNCGEISDKEMYLCELERVETKGGRGSVNLIIKCKFCAREGHVEIMKDSVKPYEVDHSGQFSTVATFECRGVELQDFSPRRGWTVKGLDSPSEWEDVDLSEGDWSEYDENTDQAVGIYEVESQFIAA